MKHMRKIHIEAHDKEIFDYCTCDICHEIIRAESCYDINDVLINHSSGKQFPEGTWGTETAFDLCSRCFKEKLVPFLKSQGAEPRVTEWDR